MKPYGQGDVDGLCGLYSVLNALRLIEKRMKLGECYEITTEWLTALEKRRGNIASLITGGLKLTDVNFVINLMSSKFKIHKTRPFYNQADIPLDAYWDTVKSFLNEGNRRAVIIGYVDRSLYDSHWSVIKQITGETIHLFDSCGTRWLYKKRCTTNRMNGKREIVFYPAQTYFLMKSGV